MTRRQFVSSLAGVAGGAVLARVRPAQAERPPLRVAVSLETLAGANVNDARAAYRVWGEEVAQRLVLHHVEMLSQVFIPSAELMQMIRAGQVDCFALTAWEYESVLEFIDPSYTIIEDYVGDGIDYLLLVKRGASYGKIEDLKGGKLLLHHHRDTSLLRIWLSLLLGESSRTAPEQLFESVEMRDQINEVILPVFFGKVQAAGLTRHAFSMAAELNPQLGRGLRILASSPKVVPVGFWFRKGCDAEDRRAFQQAMVQLSSVNAGRQVLALYQASGFTQRPATVMNGTLEMIRQYERMRKKSAGGR